MPSPFLHQFPFSATVLSFILFIIFFSFARNQQEFQPILVNGPELEVVQRAKLLDVTVTCNLSWNENINDIVKKASKRLYFLVQLKRAKLLAKI